MGLDCKGLILFALPILQVLCEECSEMNMTLVQRSLRIDSASREREREARPNFVFFFPDGWRFDWDGFAWPHVETPPLRLPTLKKLAAGGVRFTQAYVPSPICQPSRSSMASGREYDALKYDEYADSDTLEMPTFFSLLRDAGYHTMTTGKDDLTKGTQLGMSVNFTGCPDCVIGDGRYHQAELGFSDGFRSVDKFALFKYWPIAYETLGAHLNATYSILPNGSDMNNFGILHDCYNATSQLENSQFMTALDTEVCNDQTYTDAIQEDAIIADFAIRLLRRRPADQPFFLQIAYLSPHEPMLINKHARQSVTDRTWPEPYNNSAGVPFPGGKCVFELAGPDGNATRCNYAALLEAVDIQIQKVLDELEKQNVLKETVIIFSSDHGELLGDHGLEGKDRYHQSSSSVPLFFSGSGVPRGMKIERPVANMDIAGTILDIANVRPDQGMTTKSLKALWESNAYRDYVSSGYAHWRMVVKEVNGVIYKYVRCCYFQCTDDTLEEALAVIGMINTSTFFHQRLIEVQKDPYDMWDLSSERADVVKALCPLLPTQTIIGDFTFGCP